MEFEFQESEVIFADDPDQMIHGQPNAYNHMSSRDMPILVYGSSPRIQVSPRRSQNKVEETSSSPPVGIPEIRILRSPEHSDDSIGEEDGDKGMVPPHVIVRRRIAGKMTSSACARNGRILKGRYMSEVRNSVLRMTGFLES